MVSAIQPTSQSVILRIIDDAAKARVNSRHSEVHAYQTIAEASKQSTAKLVGLSPGIREFLYRPLREQGFLVCFMA